MTERKNPEKKPPKEPIKSVQFDLFSQFVANDKSEVSNTVEYWESIPKYFLTPKQITKLRTIDGLAKPYEWDYTVKNMEGRVLPCKSEIQPALIKQEDGNYKAFFPTKAEETIEEVLKKIFTDQQYGIHDPQNLESWVKFSYSMIRRELYRMNCGRTYEEIKLSLEIMSKCILTVWEGKKEVYTGAILQNYCRVDREKYLEDTDALHVAQLPVFLSHALNTLQYRQYNYLRFMDFKEQLTRYLYKKLINRFIQASYMTEYSFMYSDIKQASGLLQQERERDNRIKVTSAFEELQEKGVILSCEVDERKEGRTIVEVKYTVKAAPDFIKEQKAANKRATDAERQALNSGMLLVDK
ncbi:hypothetical protein W03_26080 [Nitrosomonas sp. PY1]|uniref:hypothetical protein n=1 Tax=Nitrosomonas sp. PY1 TaxID=1803906 RepID=UPI001FC85555|nr:hypothetical protein [Nitrosomonas sp. PY1]GKS70604.1 hypothetical protein W03_26080 [Nitrosomonas sp. PY1]